MYTHIYIHKWMHSAHVFHFIAPANSHTQIFHTLPVYCCINRLSWLGDFLEWIFLTMQSHNLHRQWGSWKALDERYKGLVFIPVLVRHFLGSLGLSGLLTNISWTHSYSKQSYWKVWPTSACLPTPTPSSLTCSPPYAHLHTYLWYCSHCKKVAHNPAVATKDSHKSLAKRLL